MWNQFTLSIVLSSGTRAHSHSLQQPFIHCSLHTASVCYCLSKESRPSIVLATMFGKLTCTGALGLVALFSSQADAYWRMSCPGTVFTGRVDPIVSPGKVSGHVHVVLGGNGFAPTMDYASTQKSTCTTCTIKGDLSNYWVPTLYYRAKNSTFINVPLAGGQGGTVYYQQRATYKGNTTITAFPEGFRMLAGSPDNRVVDTTNTTQQAVSYVCLDYSGKTKYPEGEILPEVACPDGVRAQVYFPQCWDGKNLDSSDHKSHMAYPSQYNAGECPDSHPVPVMGLFYEFLFATGGFEFWTPSDAKQPFVFSMGDPTGRGVRSAFCHLFRTDLLLTFCALVPRRLHFWLGRQHSTEWYQQEDQPGRWLRQRSSLRRHLRIPRRLRHLVFASRSCRRTNNRLPRRPPWLQSSQRR